ncbi:MAG: hypothetical protein E7660_02365 [Ruminococcaceae bacterium]|nr:hypothetical protein [Oscillospiraceae bacterium]
MKNLTLKALAILIAVVMLLLPVSVFAADVNYAKGAALQADVEGLICTAEYEACAYDYTVYTFSPAETGKYTISSDKLLGIVSNNGMWITTPPSETTVTETSVTWECKSVGQRIWVAVLTQGQAATITVEYEPIEIITIPVIVYENTTTPEAFVFEEDAAALVNVNAQDEKVDAPVLGPDGLYRLNEATGPRIFVDLNDEQMSLAAALDYGQLKIAVFNDEGKTDHYVDYCEAFSEYLDCADSKTGLYPLTEDLMEIYKEVGTYKGWYTEEGWLGFTKDDAWMFACYYFIGEVYEDDVEEWPETDTAKLETLSKKIFTENGRDIIELTANTEDKSVYSFTAWESGIYTVILEGDSTLEAWAVNSEGEIIASTEGATTSIASIDIEADADETVYIVTRTLHTAETSVVIIINYFSGIDGDVNSDGELTAKDSALLKKYLAGAVDPDKVSEKGMDIDGNGDINAQDSVKLKKALRS